MKIETHRGLNLGASMRQTLLGLLTLFCLVARPAAALPCDEPASGPKPAAVEEETESEYLSDFLVFVGGDPQGRLLLAIDLNRGRKGARLRGEQFVALHLEGQGWQEVGGRSDLTISELQQLPESPDWTVDGDRQSGYRVTGSKRGIELTTGRLEAVAIHSRGPDLFSTGSGSGSLRLGERTLTGVVHHEYCFLRGINPLFKTYTDLFGDGFHGLYLSFGQGDQQSALRLHQSGGRLEPLILRQSGFERSPAGASRLDLGRLRISDWSLGGLFRWPGRYRLDWRRAEGAEQVGSDALRSELRFDLKVRQRETVINYVFGGVAVAVLDGTTVVDGQAYPTYGIALIVR
jgi:hypothetical protein